MPHDPKLVEAVARAIACHGLAPEIQAKYADLRWGAFITDATAALDAIEAAGRVVVPRAPLQQLIQGYDLIVAGLGADYPHHSHMPERNDKSRQSHK